MPPVTVTQTVIVCPHTLLAPVPHLLDLPSETAVSRDLHVDRRRLRKLVDERVVEPAGLDGDRILVARRDAHPSEVYDHSIVALTGPVELVSRSWDGRARAADCQEPNAPQLSCTACNRKGRWRPNRPTTTTGPPLRRSFPTDRPAGE